MVPAILVHCINEIEARGLNEIGLYRISGSEMEVKELKQKLLRTRGTPNLKNVDIPTLTGVVKSFLRSLNESLIPHNTYKDLIASTNAKNTSDISPMIMQAFNELPQPNRDTLAFLMIHLKR